MKVIKKVATLVWCVVVCLPCLLVFSEGNNGSITIWNIVGIVWMMFLAKVVFIAIVPRWMRSYLNKFCKI